MLEDLAFQPSTSLWPSLGIGRRGPSLPRRPVRCRRVSPFGLPYPLEPLAVALPAPGGPSDAGGLRFCPSTPLWPSLKIDRRGLSRPRRPVRCRKASPFGLPRPFGLPSESDASALPAPGGPSDAGGPRLSAFHAPLAFPRNRTPRPFPPQAAHPMPEGLAFRPSTPLWPSLGIDRRGPSLPRRPVRCRRASPFGLSCPFGLPRNRTPRPFPLPVARPMPEGFVFALPRSFGLPLKPTAAAFPAPCPLL